MVLHPLLSPLNQLLQVALQVLRSVAGQLVDDLLAVGLPGLLVDGLEDLALHVVLQLLPRVTPVSHTEDRVHVRQEEGDKPQQLCSRGEGFPHTVKQIDKLS